MTANERDLGVDVVYGCFSEGSDCILRDFSCLPQCKESETFVLEWNGFPPRIN